MGLVCKRPGSSGARLARRAVSGWAMEVTALPLPPAIWAATPRAARAPILARRERSRELETRPSQHSSNFSRAPSSDPPHVPAKRRALPSGRRRGGQPGHREAYRPLLPVKQMDEVVTVSPDVCWHGQQPFPGPTTGHRDGVWRHQVVELLPLAVRVTECKMALRWCTHCGRRTRASLPPGVPRRPFGARLTAAIALLSGRYRLGRRERRQLLPGLWAVAGRGGAPRAGLACRAGTRRRGSPGRRATGRRGGYGRDGLAAGAAAGLAMDGRDGRADGVSD